MTLTNDATHQTVRRNYSAGEVSLRLSVNDSVTVEANGFKKHEARASSLHAAVRHTRCNAVARRDEQAVEVTATSPLTTTRRSNGLVIIPAGSAERRPQPVLSKLDNNVTQVGDPRFVRFRDQSGSSTISLPAARSAAITTIDNIPITDFSNRAVIIPD